METPDDEPPQLFEFGDPFYLEHQSRVNGMIGKLTLARVNGDPLVKEVHQELIDFANWFDETFEEEA